MRDQNDHNFATTLGTALIFISTVAVSQVLQRRLEGKRRRKEKIEQMRVSYKMKRLRDRLSYTDVTAMALSRAPPPQNDSTSRSTLSSQRMADEDVFDGLPKNSNWCHFEHRNEEDVLAGINTPSEGPADDTDDISSSSSETFLWTDAKPNQRRRQLRQKIPVPLKSHARASSESASPGSNSSFSWFDRLKRSLGGDDDTEIGSSDDDLGDMEQPKELPQRPFNIPKPAKGVLRSASTPEMVAMADLYSGSSNDVTQQNRTARAQYNARIMPNKVVMVRHGQSEGNVNEALYSTTPDNAMRLTKLGWDQAREAGKVLKRQVLASGEPVHFIVSPYVRTVETFHGIVSAWCDPKEFDHILDREKRVKAWYGRLLDMGLTWHEDPRIREQDFGNYQVPDKIKQYKRERHRFGPFFYRFPHGESASDVFDRVSTFLDSLWRSFDLNKSRNYVLVTHGISIRVLLARYFRYSIDQFSLLANPKNCEMVILGHDGEGKLQLDGRCELELEENEVTNTTEVVGNTFHKRLRVLPKKYVHKLNVRTSYDDQVGPPQIVGVESVPGIQKVLKAANGDEASLPPDFRRDPSISLC